MHIDNKILDYIITSPHWQNIFRKLINDDNRIYINHGNKDLYELIGFQYNFNPEKDIIISRNNSIFQIKKAIKMYQWYKNKDMHDTSIIDYFPEYKKCFYSNQVDKKVKCNSNYGIYAFNNLGLDLCIKRLKANYLTRHACFCINNNNAMSSPDKLCTNTIQFRIVNNKLKMVIQMRSSNFLTLLPYDIFNFTIFYAYVYEALKKYYKLLKISNIVVQVNSLHCYVNDLYKIEKNTLNNKCIDLYYPNNIIDFSKENIIKNLESKLENYV